MLGGNVGVGVGVYVQPVAGHACRLHWQPVEGVALRVLAFLERGQGITRQGVDQEIMVRPLSHLVHGAFIFSQPLCGVKSFLW